MEYLEKQPLEPADTGLETPFTAENDVPTDFTIVPKSSDPALNAKDVLGMLSFFDGETNRNNLDLIQVTGESGSYILAPKNKEGFSFGISYWVTLEDGRLSFEGKEDKVHKFYFTTEMEDEVMNLRLEDDIHYIPHDVVDLVIVNGKTVDSLVLSPFPEGGKDPIIDENATDVKGSFVYAANSEKASQVGNVVALYDGLHPDDRDADETSDDKLKNISYVEITDVEGSKYSFKNAELEDVMFVPDMLPVPLDAEGDPGNHSIKVKESVMDYSDSKYANMNLDGDTRVQTGDFIAFYTGEWNTPTESVPEYARVTGVSQESDAYQDVS